MSGYKSVYGAYRCKDGWPDGTKRFGKLSLTFV